MRDERKEVEARDLVELRFLEAVAARLPDDEPVLKAIGDLYTRVGLYEKGLAVDTRLARLCPADPLVWYNLACSQALLNQRDVALQSLRRAVKLGYHDHEWMSRDTDLRSLREEQGFKLLLKQLTACAGKKPNDADNA